MFNAENSKYTEVAEKTFNLRHHFLLLTSCFPSWRALTCFHHTSKTRLFL